MRACRTCEARCLQICAAPAEAANVISSPDNTKKMRTPRLWNRRQSIPVESSGFPPDALQGPTLPITREALRWRGYDSLRTQPCPCGPFRNPRPSANQWRICAPPNRPRADATLRMQCWTIRFATLGQVKLSSTRRRPFCPIRQSSSEMPVHRRFDLQDSRRSRTPPDNPSLRDELCPEGPSVRSSRREFRKASLPV